MFDDQPDSSDPDPRDDSLEWTEEVVSRTPKGRKQLKFMVAREAGQVRELRIEYVPTSPTSLTKLEPVLKLDREAAGRLIELVHALPYIPVDGAITRVRLDEQTMRDFLADPDAVLGFYKRDPEQFRQLIANDTAAEDVIAIAHRKEVVAEFRKLLEDDDYFDALVALQKKKSKEAIWQKLLEANPWILGVSLTGQLLTNWNKDKLEQTVAGYTVSGAGKRSDGLLRTNGQIRSLVFAEIKHHRTDLISQSPYRPEVFQPSSELTGGIAQAQQTTYRATAELHGRLAERDADGAETGEHAYLAKPRSFLILGSLGQLRSAGGVHLPKFRSFELFRRSLVEPEIVTFDELLARAEWHVEAAEKQEPTSE